MTWIGKVGGGILGFIAAGPVGAAIGAALGHQFDRGAGGAGFEFPGLAAPEPATPEERQQQFFATTFATLGHLAKADGRVSEAEISAARLIMQEMRLSPADMRLAEQFFTSGKRADYPLDREVRALRVACRQNPDILRTFLELQVDFALDKGQITLAERRVLDRIGALLGVAAGDLAQFEAVLRARRAFRQNGAGGDRPISLAGAYQALGVEPGATDDEVKKAYRRLMNQHHPDKQSARGLPEAMLEVAKERTREIRAAYEVVREHRGFR